MLLYETTRLVKPTHVKFFACSGHSNVQNSSLLIQVSALDMREDSLRDSNHEDVIPFEALRPMNCREHNAFRPRLLFSHLICVKKEFANGCKTGRPLD